MMNHGRLSAAGQLDFGRKSPRVQFLVTLQVEQRILTVLAIEFFRHKINDDVVPILATQAMIAVGRDHIDMVPLDPHDRDVESSATEIEHEYRLILFELIHAISESSRGWLVNNL